MQNRYSLGMIIILFKWNNNVWISLEIILKHIIQSKILLVQIVLLECEYWNIVDVDNMDDFMDLLGLVLNKSICKRWQDTRKKY